MARPRAAADRERGIVGGADAYLIDQHAVLCPERRCR